MPWRRTAREVQQPGAQLDRGYFYINHIVHFSYSFLLM